MLISFFYASLKECFPDAGTSAPSDSVALSAQLTQPSPTLPPTKSKVSANHGERKGWKFFMRYFASPSIAAYLLFSFLTPASVLSHAGHGDEFHSESEAATTAESIQVDAQTVKRMGIQVNPIVRQPLDVGIKTTGQIETFPCQQVEVTAPAVGKVVQLLVEPGNVVEKNQTIAILSSHELTELRVNSLEKRAEAEGNITDW
ncbi:biotin/lipoyl-binding protein [Microcoleus sp. FACHB-672]|uniref:biotin/lipoyl-binding protein n=1 Tax=Microcoleus sp. FACHB-672 TaxID=2692825 RepID=UPI001F555A69|nr:biotin/lipoyl-binding protein [Microcoleus sp. FACHB-672]